MIHVVAPGFLTSVQDLGRFGWAHIGVSASGAADALALRAGNLLVGNHEGAAALEITLAGGTFEFDAPAVCALTGGGFEADAPMWEAFEARAVRCGPARTGARCYLCVRGGIGVPPVLGSRSTHLLTGIGGHCGRALRRGDALNIGNAAIRRPRSTSIAPPPIGPRLRILPGPQADWFPSALSGEYEVTEEADRMGLRLRGPALERPAREMITEGVPLGAVQVPAGGQPIILFVEHQTTGGYPKIACVISADLRAVGQLRPRDKVSFEEVSPARALELLRAQEEWLYRLV